MKVKRNKSINHILKDIGRLRLFGLCDGLSMLEMW
jgi:hypothetical protein